MVFALTHVLTTRLVLGSRLYEAPFLYAELSVFSNVVVDRAAAARAGGAFVDAVEYTDMRTLMVASLGRLIAPSVNDDVVVCSKNGLGCRCRPWDQCSECQ